MIPKFFPFFALRILILNMPKVTMNHNLLFPFHLTGSPIRISLLRKSDSDKMEKIEKMTKEKINNSKA